MKQETKDRFWATILLLFGISNVGFFQRHLVEGQTGSAAISLFFAGWMIWSAVEKVQPKPPTPPTAP